jgi:orotate phosphoribosyltransferase
VVPGKRGEDAIRDFMEKTNIPVYSVAGIMEVVRYLHKEKTPVLINGKRRAIDEETKAIFDDYMKTYGINRTARGI